jgi:hypothetical protein
MVTPQLWKWMPQITNLPSSTVWQNSRMRGLLPPHPLYVFLAWCLGTWVTIYRAIISLRSKFLLQCYFKIPSTLVLPLHCETFHVLISWTTSRPVFALRKRVECPCMIRVCTQLSCIWKRKLSLRSSLTGSVLFILFHVSLICF